MTKLYPAYYPVLLSLNKEHINAKDIVIKIEIHFEQIKKSSLESFMFMACEKDLLLKINDD